MAGRWRVLGYDTEVAWRAEQDAEGHVTGFDAGGWPASIWLLNTIHEVDVTGPVPTPTSSTESSSGSGSSNSPSSTRSTSPRAPG